jgi:predicted nucleotidyltransferase
MSDVVTVSERKARETLRRRSAAASVMSELREFGHARGGKFIVFGSAAEDRMKFDSDFDVVVDFPSDRETEAVDFVEDLCRKHDLPADVHLKSVSSERFLGRIRDHMIVLP